MIRRRNQKNKKRLRIIVRGKNKVKHVEEEFANSKRQEMRANKLKRRVAKDMPTDFFTPRVFEGLNEVKDLEINDSLWVIGTGSGVSRIDSNLISELNTRDTIAFHNAYPFCDTMYGIKPKFWTWLDPNPTYDGLDRIAQGKDNGITCLVHPGLMGDMKTFRTYFGNTLCDYGKYHELLYQAHQQNPICKLEGTSIKALNDNDKRKVSDNPKIRNSFGFVVGTVYYPGPINPPKRKGAVPKVDSRMYMTENKLTSYILPLAYYLGYKNVFFIGFEGIGGRFFEPSNTTIGAGRMGYDIGFPLWERWSSQTGMNIYSLLNNNHSKTARWFKHIDLKTSLKKF